MTSDYEPGSLELRDALVQVSFAVIAILSRAAAAHDLSLTQLRVLGILRDREPTMAELAAFLGLERSTVSGLVDRAVARGYVRRAVSDEDGRVVRVVVTPEGRRLEAPLTEEIGRRIEPILHGLSSSEKRRLRELLEKVFD